MAIYLPTPGLKERTFKLFVLIRWDCNFCVRSSPLWGQPQQLHRKQGTSSLSSNGHESLGTDLPATRELTTDERRSYVITGNDRIPFVVIAIEVYTKSEWADYAALQTSDAAMSSPETMEYRLS